MKIFTHTSAIAIVLSTFIFFLAGAARGGQWTYDHQSHRLRHSTTEWVLAVSASDANLSVIGIFTQPKFPSTLPLDDAIVDGFKIAQIGIGAFSNSRYLASVTLPNSVKDIDQNTFAACVNLTSVSLPDSVTNVSTSAFLLCASLTNISVAVGNPIYRSIDGAVFDKTGATLIMCPQGKKEYDVPDGTTSIWHWAFGYRDGLAAVSLPASVTNIGKRAFFNCEGLTNILVSANNPIYCSIDGVLFSKDETRLILYPAARKGTYKIPNSVTDIGDSAFEQCVNLTSVVIPNGVTSIGYAAFERCSGLADMTIPNNVTNIGHSAFNECNGLTNVVIGSGVASINGNTFSRCANLTSVTIPDSVTSIGRDAFLNCVKLTSIAIPASATNIHKDAFFRSGIQFDKVK